MTLKLIKKVTKGHRTRNFSKTCRIGQGTRNHDPPFVDRRPSSAPLRVEPARHRPSRKRCRLLRPDHWVATLFPCSMQPHYYRPGGASHRCWLGATSRRHQSSATSIRPWFLCGAYRRCDFIAQHLSPNLFWFFMLIWFFGRKKTPYRIFWIFYNFA